MNTKQSMFFIYCVFFLFFCFSNTVSANVDNNIQITNLSSSQFTVLWMSDTPNCSNIQLFHDDNHIDTFYDDRGKDYKGRTHYFTIKNLRKNTRYFISIGYDSNEKSTDNNLIYPVTTLANVLPVGSIQPAGKVLIDNANLTPASNAIVLINVSNGQEDSAPLSTIVDKNGFWFIELINARDISGTKLYAFSENDILIIKTLSEDYQSIQHEFPLIDKEVETQLYPPIILK